MTEADFSYLVCWCWGIVCLILAVLGANPPKRRDICTCENSPGESGCYICCGGD